MQTMTITQTHLLHLHVPACVVAALCVLLMSGEK
jgi:hypothetical protein